MVRIAAAVLLLAVVCLTASSLLWLRATNRGSALADGASGAAMLEELERAASPTADVDVAARYTGRGAYQDFRVTGFSELTSGDVLRTESRIG